MQEQDWKAQIRKDREQGPQLMSPAQIAALKRELAAMRATRRGERA